MFGHLTEEEVHKLKSFLSLFPLASHFQGYSTGVDPITIRMFVDEYSNFIKSNRSQSYYDSVTLCLKHFTAYFGAPKILQSITYKEMEGFISNLQKRVPKGYRVYFRTLKSAMNKAIDWGYIKENHFVKIKLPKKQQTYPSYIGEGELSNICSRIDNSIIRDIVKVAFYTGLRLNELLNLTWKDIDFTTTNITVGGINFTTKSRGARIVPMCSEVQHILTVLKNVSINSYVFSKSSGARYTDNHVSKAFKKACKAAKVDSQIHFHSLRHSTASILAQNGVSIYVIKDILGHSSIVTTQIYSHLNAETLKAAIRTFDKK